MKQTPFYYIYLFREIKTQKIIYVGSTRTIGARINEHRRGFRDKTRQQPIHKYMIANNLELFKDVEIAIVYTASTKKDAIDKEIAYTEKHKKTIANVWTGEQKEDLNNSIRKPVSTPDGKQCFSSMREAADCLGVTRHKVYKMVESGELIEIELTGKYINETTGEVFTSGYQLQKRYNLSTKLINKLSKSNECVINGMKIKKV